MSVRLFIGNLPYSATEADLREHLSGVGAPTQIVLPTDRETGRPRGFAFVDYTDRAVAEEAIRRFNQQPFKGRPLAVSEARPREDRPAGPRPGGFSRSASGRATSSGFERPAAGRVYSPRPERRRASPAARAAATSARMRRPRTSASRRARNPIAARAARSRSARSAASTTPTKTGARRTKRSRSTTSRRAPRRDTVPGDDDASDVRATTSEDDES